MSPLIIGSEEEFAQGQTKYSRMWISNALFVTKLDLWRNYGEMGRYIWNM
jgi:hypothetical protein